MTKPLSEYLSYQKYFTPAAMWEKISAVAKKAGIELVYAVLLLYYVAIDPATPKTDKVRIFGVIGYFILPVDIVPDALPLIGCTDDMAAVLWALKAVCDNITPAVRAKARMRLTRWFGKVDEARLTRLLAAYTGEGPETVTGSGGK